MAETNGNTKRILWGRILFFVGMALIFVGIILGMLDRPVAIPLQELLEPDSLAVTSLCCFGPFVILGMVLAIVGAVLWFSRITGSDT